MNGGALPCRRAVFLDRDGTINEEVHYLSDPAEVHLLPGIGEAIRRLNEAGVPAIVVSNQSAIARGYFDEERLAEIHRELEALLASHGASLDAIYYCPHHPDEQCACRKPKPGMLHQAAADIGIELRKSVLVGDAHSDLEAGRRAGCQTILVLTGYGVATLRGMKDRSFIPDFVAADLGEAVAWILGQRERDS